MRALFPLIVFLAVAGFCAADEIHVPDNNAAVGTNNSIPFHASWSPISGSVRYQALYKVTQLGNKAFRLSDIAFAPMYTGTFTATQFQVRVSHTTSNSLNPTMDLNIPTPTTMFDGPMTYAITTDTWSPLVLKNAFIYNGTDNLVVDIRYMGGKNVLTSGWLGKFRFVRNAIPRSWAYNNYNAKVQSGSDTIAGLKTRFTVDVTSLNGTGSTSPGGTVDLTLSSSGDAGLPYQVGTSLGNGPTPIDTRTLGLSLDDLLLVSVNGWWPTIFSGYQGVLDAQGGAGAKIHIPNLAVLKGVRLHSAFVTLLASAPSGIKSISNTFTFTIQ